MPKTPCLIIAIMALTITQKMVTSQYFSASPVAFHFNPALLNSSAVPKKQVAEPDTNVLKRNGWYAEAVKKLQQKEYEFNKEADSSTYSTPNRSNNLRIYYTNNGFTVQPRTVKIPIGKADESRLPDKIQYKTLPNWKVAFKLDKKQVGEGMWQIAGNKAEYITNNITVQYINNEEGMRQNFIVRSPLCAAGDLKLHFNIETALQQRVQTDRIQFIHKTGGVVLNYDRLKVWDANGRPLEASFEKSSRDYCIHVQSKNAAYPITIDPLSSTAVTRVESSQDNAYMGSSIASAGDVNGDGYSDIIVGAYQYDNGQNDEGAAFIYHGSASGIGATAAVMLESNQAQAYLGYSVAGAGDVNGDGFSDVIVGAYFYDNGLTDEGAAFIYHGSATGIGATAAAMMDGNQTSADFGYSVAGAGDVNGDGYSDVIVGAYQYDNGNSNEGAAFVYHGSATGINTTAVVSVESNQNSAWLGCSVAGAGDVNGDGYSDIIVGAYFYDYSYNNEGIALVYKGSATGIGGAPAVLRVSQDFAYFGYSVAGAGDVNGDGYSDVIVGAYGYDNGTLNEGAAFIFAGTSGGTSTSVATTLDCNQSSSNYGYSVACAGDINGDGYSEVMVGAIYYDNGNTDEGAAFIYQGSPSGVNTASVVTRESDQNGAAMGRSVAGAGDVNGDGYSDVLIGANRYDNGNTDEGAAFIYHGSPSGINTTAGTTLESNQDGACLGQSLAAAGDVNGDGYSDVIIGAYLYDNGQTDEGAAFIFHGAASGLSTTAAARVESNQSLSFFGATVATAGDVNGDGYADVIVGAREYDNGQTNEGAAFIYHGSASGIGTTAARMVESDQAGANFGWSVSCAGDVNDDGYSDIVAGATNYDNGQADEGAVYVYHGSSTGIGSTAAVILESNQSLSAYGIAVATAGDVNGDGYGDIIVGAALYDNGETDEGAVFVYRGSATGISSGAVTTLEKNQANGNFGIAVAGAGDVNADGYNDIIVGASAYDNGETDEGAAFVYHGSSSGIGTAAAATLESNQASANFGMSVAGAGDVNGDGYSDLIVGAYNYDNGQTDEGAAFVYHGSSSGISTTAIATIESNQASAYLGSSAAGAGDVNGDGFSDVIAGAYAYDNGNTNEGAAFVYYGNTPYQGKHNNLDLYNIDLSTPVSRSNISQTNFGAGLFARSFFGRTKGKLVWETKISYNAFSGSPIANSVVYTSQQSSYTNLGTAGTTLKNLVAKQPGARYTKIRARVKYDLTTALTGQVYGPWRYVPDILSAASLGVLPIDLISFRAEWVQTGKTAQVKFVTANESGVCCYDIERSSDGVSYTSIGKLQAKNTGNENAYSFTDQNVTGKKIYYRLKTNFTGGAVDYSSIQLLQNNTVTDIMVFPNPATHVLKLQLNNNYGSMNVLIINSTGQTVQQFTSLSTAGQMVTIPVNNLVAGIYFLHLQSGPDKQVLQFVKQ